MTLRVLRKMPVATNNIVRSNAAQYRGIELVDGTPPTACEAELVGVPCPYCCRARRITDDD
ncbi:MAG TPA: hypothetical protein VGP82_23580 [Ktedonobacterales bacterium]|jgi:hypothetical protein|nr:hypothetical protein [Ktedonobacterales bacterium]